MDTINSENPEPEIGTNNQVIRIHNKLVESQSTISLGEQRILFYICAFLIKNSDLNLKESYEINVSKFKEIYGLDKSNSVYEYLDKLTDSLINRKLKIQKPHGEGFQKINWISYIDYKEGKGVLEVSFTSKMKPYLINLKSFFTEVGMMDFSSLSCKHSVWFLLQTVKWLKIGKREYTVEDLRKIVGVEEKSYLNFFDLKKRVIERAESELKKHSKYFFSWKVTGKKRKKIEKITLFFHKKQEEKKQIISAYDPVGQNVDNLVAIGFSKSKAVELDNKYKSDFLSWIITQLEERKNEKLKKDEKIKNYEAYFLAIIEREENNFRVDYEERKQKENKQEEFNKIRKRKQKEEIEKYIENQYSKKLRELASEKYFQFNNEEQTVILKEFESTLEGVFIDFYKKNKLEAPGIKMKFTIFLKEKLQIANTYHYTKFISDHEYEILESSSSFFLKKGDEIVKI